MLIKADFFSKSAHQPASTTADNVPVSSKLTFASKITILRISLVPIFITLVIMSRNWACGSQYLPLAIFLFAALLDIADGHIARKHKQITYLGTLLDPLADKLLTISALVILVSRHSGDFFGSIPSWILAVVLIREFVLITGAGIVFWVTGKITVQPRFSGKTASFLLAVVIALSLAGTNHLILLWASIPAALATTIAGLQYTVDGLHQLLSSD